MKIDTKAKQSS